VSVPFELEAAWREEITFPIRVRRAGNSKTYRTKRSLDGYRLERQSFERSAGTVSRPGHISTRVLSQSRAERADNCLE
jgi:hypothetical protein